MTKKQADERISQLREEAWQEHLKMQKADGSCRLGCPLHAKKKVLCGKATP